MLGDSYKNSSILSKITLSLARRNNLTILMNRTKRMILNYLNNEDYLSSLVLLAAVMPLLEESDESLSRMYSITSW